MFPHLQILVVEAQLKDHHHPIPIRVGNEVDQVPQLSVPMSMLSNFHKALDSIDF
jgi:hypothetical protein